MPEQREQDQVTEQQQAAPEAAAHAGHACPFPYAQQEDQPQQRREHRRLGEEDQSDDQWREDDCGYDALFQHGPAPLLDRAYGWNGSAAETSFAARVVIKGTVEL